MKMTQIFLALGLGLALVGCSNTSQKAQAPVDSTMVNSQAMVSTNASKPYGSPGMAEPAYEREGGASCKTCDKVKRVKEVIQEQEVTDCHKTVKVISQEMPCSSCTYPVSIRANANTCQVQ
jgi:hypothetical protein